MSLTVIKLSIAITRSHTTFLSLTHPSFPKAIKTFDRYHNRINISGIRNPILEFILVQLLNHSESHANHISNTSQINEYFSNIFLLLDIWWKKTIATSNKQSPVFYIFSFCYVRTCVLSVRKSNAYIFFANPKANEKWQQQKNALDIIYGLFESHENLTKSHNSRWFIYFWMRQ